MQTLPFLTPFHRVFKYMLFLSETVCYEITVTTGGKDSGRLMQSDAYIILFGDKAMTGRIV